MPRSQQPPEGQKIMLRHMFEGRYHIGTIIDLGAGDGHWGRLIRKYGPESLIIGEMVAIEIWKPTADANCLHELYDKVLIMNGCGYDGWDRADIIILGDVLEHMYRHAALDLIAKLRATKARVYLTVPITPCPQDGTVYGNPYETHLDQWTHQELMEMGWQLLHRGMNERGTVEIGTYVLGR